VNAERVLVRVPSWLGDLVQAEPAVRALYERAGERLSIAGPAHLLGVLDGRFELARRIPHEGRGGERASAWRGHATAVLFTGSWRSAWTAWRATIARRIGWARDGRAPLLTQSAAPARERGGVPLGLGVRGRWPRPLPRPFVADCVDLVQLAGVAVRDPRPRLAAQPAAARTLAARLEAAGLERFALLNVGGRRGSAKSWSTDSWAQVARGVRARLGLRSLLVAGPGEEERVAAVAALAAGAEPVAAADPVLDLAGLVAACARATLVVTADSGPRHVASAAGAPVVVVCGPTDPRHTAAPLDDVRLVREPVACGPCHLERCPLVGAAEHACMRRVAPERVVAAAAELMGG